MGDVSFGKVISGEGGTIPASVSARKKLCLLSSGDLYVAESYVTDMSVQSYTAELKHRKFNYKLHKVSVEEISRLYEEGGESEGAMASFVQEQVLRLLKQAKDARASDVHLSLTDRSFIVDFRVDGKIRRIETLTHETGKDVLGSIFQTMCESTDPTYKPSKAQDARVKKEFTHQLGLYGARVATRPLESGPSMSIRLLYSTINRGLSESGFLPEQVEQLTRLTQMKEGVVLITGTTGSGKSSTAAVMLDMVLKYYEHSIRLMTVEDPVEYKIFGAHQSPLLIDEGQTTTEAWQKAISNLVRMDPDVMMLGEIRDKGSAKTAFEAALTGHGLWSTLHTKDPISAIQRLRELGLSDNLVTDPSLIKGVISQSLIRRLCDQCKVPFKGNEAALPDSVRRRVHHFCEVDGVFLKGPNGCDHCGGSGVDGRLLVAEVFIPNLKIMQVFKESGVPTARAHWVRMDKGITKTMHLIRHINSGLVDPSMGERDVLPLDEDNHVVGSVRNAS